MSEPNKWERHEMNYPHPNGEPTTLYVQTDGRTYVLSEHPDNKGPHVSTVATKFGDGMVKSELAENPEKRPENLQLYVQRNDRGTDGECRFDKWEAKTTRLENVSEKPNHFDHQPAEWRWSNGTQYEHRDLENKLGTRLEQAPQRFQDKPVHEQNQEFADARMSSTWQSEQLREAAHQHKR